MSKSTIPFFDSNDEYDRRETWSKITKIAKNINEISKTAQRKNTSNSEAEAVIRLSYFIITLCNDHLISPGSISASLSSQFQFQVFPTPTPPASAPAQEAPKPGVLKRKRDHSQKTEAPPKTRQNSSTELPPLSVALLQNPLPPPSAPPPSQTSQPLQSLQPLQPLQSLQAQNAKHINNGNIAIGNDRNIDNVFETLNKLPSFPLSVNDPNKIRPLKVQQSHQSQQPASSLHLLAPSNPSNMPLSSSSSSSQPPSDALLNHLQLLFQNSPNPAIIGNSPTNNIISSNSSNDGNDVTSHHHHRHHSHYQSNITSSSANAINTLINSNNNNNNNNNNKNANNVSNIGINNNNINNMNSNMSINSVSIDSNSNMNTNANSISTNNDNYDRKDSQQIPFNLIQRDGIPSVELEKRLPPLPSMSKTSFPGAAVSSSQLPLLNTANSGLTLIPPPLPPPPPRDSPNENKGIPISSLIS